MAELAVWEWRGFWKNQTQLPFRLPENVSKKLRRALVEEENDIYLVVQGLEDNIKWRDGALEIKRIMEDKGYLKAFHTKETHFFPIFPETIISLFPFAGVPDEPLRDLHSLVAFLQKTREVRQVPVKKYRQKIKFKDQTRVEICQLSVEGEICCSICVEGLNYPAIQHMSSYFRLNNVIEKGYADFLLHHHIAMSA